MPKNAYCNSVHICKPVLQILLSNYLTFNTLDLHGSKKSANFVVKIRERNFPDERKPRRSSSQTHRGKANKSNKVNKSFSVMKKFETIEEAANFISSHANTGTELTINDCLCFGMSVYAYTSECIAAGIPVNSKRAAFHYLNESELITILTYLQQYDGYLIAC